MADDDAIAGMLHSPAPADFFDEMKRYVRFGPDDEAALRVFAPRAAPRFAAIADAFYERVLEHAPARAVFDGPARVERLKLTLREWMALLVAGPWDDAYYRKRRRIGRMHVQIALPQRYMFGAMNLIRVALKGIAEEAWPDDGETRRRVTWALAKAIDLELAIMLESYREAFVEKVQALEREEKLLLERQLHLSEARYEEIIESGEALIVTCQEDRIVLFNRRCEELTGVRRADAAGRSWLELFAAAEDRERFAEQLRPAVFVGRKVAPYEGTVRAPDGREHRIRWHFTALPSASGPIGCCIGLDVTEAHDLEVRTRRAERLASLGMMAAGLAHEIRNPLNAAHLQLTLLQRRLGRREGPDLDGARAAAELISTEMQRLAALVEDFLQFARPQPLKTAPASLAAIARAVVELLAPEAVEQGIDLAVEEGAGATAARAELDEEKLRQVLLNLLRNAVEATGRGGRIRVGVASDRREALLTVVDDGPGLPTPDAPIFEPFYTTKPGGTGLGLAIVHRIVADHGGRVAVESRPGRTCFTVALPRIGA